MHALVTGATGFIGRHLVRALRARGDRVTCLVRATSDRSRLEPLGVEFVEADFMDVAAMTAATAGVDVVYHLAAMLRAPWAADFDKVNADGVGRVAEACAAQPTPPVLVVVSSLAAAGATQGAPRTEADAPAPVSRYGRAKLGGELEAARFADRVPTTIVRPPMVIGQETGGGVARLFNMAKKGLFLLPTRSPMSIVHVTDLVDLTIRAADQGERLPAPGPDGPRAEDLVGQGIYFAAAPETPTLRELGERIGAAYGRGSVPMLPVPNAALAVIANAAEGWARLRGTQSFLNSDKAREARAGAWTCSAEKAERSLGFRHADLDQRIAETAIWFQTAEQ